MDSAKATYVYCVIASARRPRVSRKARGLAAMGAVRLLHIEPGLYVAVADAPLSRYGEEAINRGLTDLEWVSRAAVAHEAVIESFIGETAVLPMKLFTIFTSDARVLEHIAAQRTRIATLVKRVANHQEWGVRLMLDRAHAGGAVQARSKRAGTTSSGSSRRPGSVGPGASFLQKRGHSGMRPSSSPRGREIRWRSCTIGWRPGPGWRSAARRANFRRRAGRSCSTRRFSCRGHAPRRSRPSRRARRELSHGRDTG